MKRIVAGLAIVLALCTGAVAQNKAEATALSAAMQAVESRDWTQAASLAAPAGQIGRDIVEWHRLRGATGSFAEYQSFIARRPDWPGMPFLQKSGEASIPKNANPNEVVAYFVGQNPQTGVGALRLAAALRAVGGRGCC